MKTLVAVALLLVVSLPVVSVAQAPPNRAAIEKQLVANEKAVNDAFDKHDVKTFHSYLTPDAMSIDGDGGISKVNTPEFDKMMADVKTTDYAIDRSQFQWLNDNAVIHMYHWSGHSTYQGKPGPTNVWVSTAWVNRGGKWLAAFHQESPAMAPPPAPRAQPVSTKK